MGERQRIPARWVVMVLGALKLIALKLYLVANVGGEQVTWNKKTWVYVSALPNIDCIKYLIHAGTQQEGTTLLFLRHIKNSTNILLRA